MCSVWMYAEWRCYVVYVLCVREVCVSVLREIVMWMIFLSSCILPYTFSSSYLLLIERLELK